MVTRTRKSDSENDLIDEFFDESVLNDEIDDLLADLGDDVQDIKIKVYRARIGSKEMTWLYDCGPNEWSMQYLRDTYGSGTYRIVVREGRLIKRNKLVTVEALPKEQVTPQADNSKQFDQMIAMMQAQAEKTEKNMAAVFDSMTKMHMFMMTKQQPAQQSMSVKETIELVSTLSAMNRGSGGDASEMLKLFMEGMSMGKELGNTQDANTNDVLIEALKSVGPMFTESMKKQQAIPQRNQNPALRRPRPASQTEQQQGDNTMQWVLNQMVRPKLALLCQAAGQNLPVEPYTDQVLAQVPPAMLDEFMGNDDPVAYLESILPDIEKFRPWFQKLVDDLKVALSDDGLTDDNANANASDIPTFTGEVEPSAFEQQEPGADDSPS